MAKQSAIDRAVANLEQEIAVLNLAITKLKLQRDTKPKAGRKAKPIALAVGDGR